MWWDKIITKHYSLFHDAAISVILIAAPTFLQSYCELKEDEGTRENLLSVTFLGSIYMTSINHSIITGCVFVLSIRWEKTFFW